MNKGKKFDVLIEDNYGTDPRTGMSILIETIVYADAGKRGVIEKVEGVMNVYNTFGPTRYDVNIDPRYDREFVKREIEAALLCE